MPSARTSTGWGGHKMAWERCRPTRPFLLVRAACRPPVRYMGHLVPPPNPQSPALHRNRLDLVLALKSRWMLSLLTPALCSSPHGSTTWLLLSREVDATQGWAAREGERAGSGPWAGELGASSDPLAVPRASLNLEMPNRWAHLAPQPRAPLKGSVPRLRGCRESAASGQGHSTGVDVTQPTGSHTAGEGAAGPLPRSTLPAASPGHQPPCPVGTSQCLMLCPRPSRASPW